jgi:monoamine oxidase
MAAAIKRFDLAIVGAGVAGSAVSYRLAQTHPEWTIALFERSNRIGGRLYSARQGQAGVHVELGGMRFRPSQRNVAGLVSELGLETRPFRTAHEDNRFFLRGHASRMIDGVPSGTYRLESWERGESPGGLLLGAFDRVVPGAADLGEDDWEVVKRQHSFGDRPLFAWELSDLLGTVLSAEARKYVLDAFGYMSGIGPHNAADAIPYLLREAHPAADEQVTLADGMDRLPRELAAQFETSGGQVFLGHDLRGFDALGTDGGAGYRLTFDGQPPVDARRLVLALPRRALDVLSTGAPFLRRPDVRALVESSSAYSALKLYLWYDRPWWRDDGFAGVRLNTDLPLRKAFYLDAIGGSPSAPALLLAAYCDGSHLDDWRTLVSAPADPVAETGADPASHAAPVALVDEAQTYLRAAHDLRDPPLPLGSAYRYWGSDPRLAGWHYWRAGVSSWDVKARIPQPDHSLPVYLCGEAWSTSQAWVEGSLESAISVVERLA